MLKHVFHPLAPWGLPGGWMDAGETPEVCAMRELREETGLITAVLGETLHYFRNTSPDHLNMIILAHIDEKQPETKLDGVEIIESMWVTPDTLPDKLSTHTISGIQAAWNTKGIPFEYLGTDIVNTAF